MKVLRALGLVLLSVFGPTLAILIGVTMWNAMPAAVTSVLLAGAGFVGLVVVAVVHGGWAWEILGQGDEGYPFGRAGRFLHLFFAFAVLAVVGYIMLAGAR